MPTVFFTPCFLANQDAISKFETSVALQRLAIADASAMWSSWPCETRMNAASTSAAFTGLAGLWSKKGSTRTLCPAVSISQVACPYQVSLIPIGHWSFSAQDPVHILL